MAEDKPARSFPRVLRQSTGRPTTRQRYRRVLRNSASRNEFNRAASTTNCAPTQAQIKAGNYKKGSVPFCGLTIKIENPKGSSRKEDWPPLSAHYGYIRGTTGKDGDPLDCFIGPWGTIIDLVFVVDQEKRDGRFDEHKILFGFLSEKKAKEAYLANYDKNWRCGAITSLTMGEFKDWLKNGDTTKRIAKQVTLTI